MEISQGLERLCSYDQGQPVRLQEARVPRRGKEGHVDVRVGQRAADLPREEDVRRRARHILEGGKAEDEEAECAVFPRGIAERGIRQVQAEVPKPGERLADETVLGEHGVRSM
jgi:hypothetical protein